MTRRCLDEGLLQAYLDGELCGVLPDGRTAFNLIQNASDTGQGSLVPVLQPQKSRSDIEFEQRQAMPRSLAIPPK